MLQRGQRHPQRSEILECFIVSSVAKDCLVVLQSDLHLGSFLLVTPIVMSNYKVPLLIVKALSFGGVLYSVTLVQSKEIPTIPPCVEGDLFVKKPGSPPSGLVVKSLGSDFPQALGSILPLSLVHLSILLSDPVLAYPAPGR